MEGKKFSSSKRVVIYVSDLLSRYQPDAFRYFVAAAGPENQDSDFTWAEFVRRTNDELVAGWGNLVNRTATLINKNFGEIPPLGETDARGRGGAGGQRAAFGTVGDLIGRTRMRQAINEAMRAVAEVNKYVSDSEPWKIKDDPARLGTILHVTAQCVADLNLVLSPFLPFSANEVDRALGGKGEFAPMPRIDEVEDLDNGAASTRSSPATTRHARVGAAADHGRRASGEADADLHQARPGDRGRGARGLAEHGCVRASPAGPRSAPRCTAPLHPDLDHAGGLRPTRWPGGSSVSTATSVLRRRRATRSRLRLFIAVRHRFAEDALADGVRPRHPAGVVLGAGLRHVRLPQPHPDLRRLRGRLPGHRRVEALRRLDRRARRTWPLRRRRRLRARGVPRPAGREPTGSTPGARVLPVARRGALPDPRGDLRRRCARGRLGTGRRGGLRPAAAADGPARSCGRTGRPRGARRRAAASRSAAAGTSPR